MRKCWVLATILVVSMFAVSSATAQQLTREDLAVASRLALEAIDARPPIVIMIDDDAPPIVRDAAFGTSATVLSRAQARAEQRAWFVYFYSVTFVPEGLRMVLSQPASGYDNALVLRRLGDTWTVASNEREHSSSGARAFYGRMYEGVACRDDTEMAQRWRFTTELVEALVARRRPPSGPSSGRCLGVTFPDVIAYRAMRR